MSTITAPLIGGILIGLASSLLLIGTGRISGISSILSQVISKPTREDIWKYFFLAGLILGSFIFIVFFPNQYNAVISSSKVEIIAAGILVGFGTRLGNGCTSGHGVCGISRLSRRSILATIIFISAGIITVAVKGAF